MSFEYCGGSPDCLNLIFNLMFNFICSLSVFANETFMLSSIMDSDTLHLTEICRSERKKLITQTINIFTGLERWIAEQNIRSLAVRYKWIIESSTLISPQALITS